MSARYTHGQSVFIQIPLNGIFSGRLRKRKSRWWFFGDVCRDVKGPLATFVRQGAKLVG